MKITKSQLKQIIKEEIEKLDPDGDADDANELLDMTNELEEIVSDHDIDYEGGFFLSLIEATDAVYLPPRKEELIKEMKNAIVQVLLSASAVANKN
jgi:hypothetical protein